MVDVLVLIEIVLSTTTSKKYPTRYSKELSREIWRDLLKKFERYCIVDERTEKSITSPFKLNFKRSTCTRVDDDHIVCLYGHSMVFIHHMY